jgi:hypothetical protein
MRNGLDTCAMNISARGKSAMVQLSRPHWQVIASSEITGGLNTPCIWVPLHAVLSVKRYVGASPLVDLGVAGSNPASHPKGGSWPSGPCFLPAVW